MLEQQDAGDSSEAGLEHRSSAGGGGTVSSSPILLNWLTNEDAENLRSWLVLLLLLIFLLLGEGSGEVAAAAASMGNAARALVLTPI